MFSIERNKFLFHVDISAETVIILPVAPSFAAFSALTKTIVSSLKLVCNYHLKDLNFEDRESYLMNYFKGKGWEVKDLKPPLSVPE